MPKSNRLPFVVFTAVASFSSAAMAQTAPIGAPAAMQPAIEAAPAPVPAPAPPPVAAPDVAPAAQPAETAAADPAAMPPAPPVAPPGDTPSMASAAAPPAFQPAAYTPGAFQPSPFAAPGSQPAPMFTVTPAQNAPYAVAPAPAGPPARDRAAEDAARDADRYQGFYVKIDLASQFAAAGKAGLGAQSNCAGCDSGLGAGGELGVRLGWSFGVVALEVSGFGGYDNSSGTAGQSLGGPAAGEYTFHRGGGGGAIGARFTYPHALVRPTVGLGVGVARRAMVFVYQGGPLSEESSTPPRDVGAVVGYTAPRLQADAGVMLGNTPGAKIELGVIASLEMAGKHAASGQVGDAISEQSGEAAAGEVALVDGPQLMIGPTLSLQFGR